MEPFDRTLASPLRIEWLVDADATTRDEFERGIALKAEAILRAARFVSQTHARDGTDAEVRVWIEAADGPGCVSVTWEPGFSAFGFHLLDETLRERLACIVFRDLPCVDADGEDEALTELVRALAEAREPHVRVNVVEHRAVDPGVER